MPRRADTNVSDDTYRPMFVGCWAKVMPSSDERNSVLYAWVLVKPQSATTVTTFAGPSVIDPPGRCPPRNPSEDGSRGTSVRCDQRARPASRWYRSMAGGRPTASHSPRPPAAVIVVIDECATPAGRPRGDQWWPAAPGTHSVVAV